MSNPHGILSQAFVFHLAILCAAFDLILGGWWRDYEVHGKMACKSWILALEYPALVVDWWTWSFDRGICCLEVAIEQEGIEIAGRRGISADFWKRSLRSGLGVED
jgi:hypothetical protein